MPHVPFSVHRGYCYLYYLYDMHTLRITRTIIVGVASDPNNRSETSAEIYFRRQNMPYRNNHLRLDDSFRRDGNQRNRSRGSGHTAPYI